MRLNWFEKWVVRAAVGMMLVWGGLLAGIEMGRFGWWLMAAFLALGLLVGFAVGLLVGQNQAADYEYIHELECELRAAQNKAEDAQKVIDIWRVQMVKDFGADGKLALRMKEFGGAPLEEEIEEAAEELLKKRFTARYVPRDRSGADDGFCIFSVFEYVKWIDKRFDDFYFWVLDWAVESFGEESDLTEEVRGWYRRVS